MPFRPRARSFRLPNLASFAGTAVLVIAYSQAKFFKITKVLTNRNECYDWQGSLDAKTEEVFNLVNNHSDAGCTQMGNSFVSQ